MVKDEQALLLLVAQGDRRAFITIIDRYTDVIYPYLLYWLKRAELAEEITQDVFMRVWKNREKLPWIDNFGGYIYVIARNRLNTALKEESFNNRPLDNTQFNDLLNPQSSLEVKELTAIVELGIQSLPARRKEVFILSRTQELTYEQIAARLGISKSAVRQHIVEALVFLRHYLKEHAGIIISSMLCSCCRLTIWLDFFSS